MSGAPPVGAPRLLDALDADLVLRLVAETTNDGLLVLDGDGVVALMNPAAQAMLGFARAELLGTVLHDCAVPVIRSITCCGDHDGWALTSSAASPATCGAAIEVPM